MKCPRCEHENEAGARFCEECASPLARVCAKCGRPLSATAKFCPECAHPTSPSAAALHPRRRFASPESYTPKHLVERILTSRTALEGERKQVTVLFADTKGSMGLLADRDPEDARKLLDPVLELMMEAVHRYEGTVNQVMGDGIMALFGAPLAHEDHAVRACYAALRIQDSVKRYAHEVEAREGIAIRIRIGLNSGEVVVRSIGNDLHMDYTAVGQSTHLAARLEQAAPPGCILLSTTTVRLAEGYVEVRDLGPITVKELSRPIGAFELLGAAAARSRLQALVARGFTKFVDREAELAELERATERAKVGRGQVVAVVGEPGVGKSRVLWEFTRSPAADDFVILETDSVSYGKSTPYLAVVSLLRAYFDIDRRDDAGNIRNKVSARVVSVGRDLEPVLPALLSLLDVPSEDAQWQRLEPRERRQRVLDSVRSLLLRHSHATPLFLVFHDLHWIDAESQAVLDTLVESLRGAPILLLVTYRPEYQHRWAGKTYYTQLRIDPLPREHAEELLRATLGADVSLAPLKRRLIERTEGNPFFLEESIRTLVESGAVTGDEGTFHLAHDVTTIEIAPTVQAVLAARVDRLTPAEKRLLQAAAAIGDEVPFAVLEAVGGLPDDEFRQHLGHLQAAEFVHEKRLFPELEYAFKHALTREVAYASLLAPQRRALHAAIGRALERLYGARLGDVVDRLAYHYSRAEAGPKAVEYLTRFAEKVARIDAHAEAVRILEDAVPHAERLPGGERDRRILDIVLRQAYSLFHLGRFQKIVELLVPRQELVDRLSDPTLAGPYHFRLGHTYTFLGDYVRGEQSLRRALDEARRCGDAPTMGEVYTLLSLGASWLGEVEEGIRHAREAVSLLERADRPSWLGMAHWVMGFNYIMAGDFERALAAAALADRIGAEIGDARLQCYAAFSNGWIHGMRGDYAAGLAACERSLERSPGPVNTAIARGFVGYIHLGQGDVERAISSLTEAIEQSAQFRQRHSQVLFTAYLGDAWIAAGRPERARELATEALGMAREAQFRWGIGALQAVLGKSALAQGALVEADACLGDALATFESMPAMYMIACVRLQLAEVAHARADTMSVTAHLQTARHLFKQAAVPTLVNRTDELARRLENPTSRGGGP